MSPRPDPPAALMASAEELRAHHAQAGIGRDELGAKASCSPSLIAMIKTGRRSPSRKLAELLDAVFSLPGTFARLEKGLRDVPFPASFRPFVPHEAKATTLRSCENSPRSRPVPDRGLRAGGSVYQAEHGRGCDRGAGRRATAAAGRSQPSAAAVDLVADR